MVVTCTEVCTRRNTREETTHASWTTREVGARGTRRPRKPKHDAAQTRQEAHSRRKGSGAAHVTSMTQREALICLCDCPSAARVQFSPASVGNNASRQHGHGASQCPDSWDFSQGLPKQEAYCLFEKEKGRQYPWSPCGTCRRLATPTRSSVGLHVPRMPQVPQVTQMLVSRWEEIHAASVGGFRYRGARKGGETLGEVRRLGPHQTVNTLRGSQDSTIESVRKQSEARRIRVSSHKPGDDGLCEISGPQEMGRCLASLRCDRRRGGIRCAAWYRTEWVPGNAIRLANPAYLGTGTKIPGYKHTCGSTLPDHPCHLPPELVGVVNPGLPFRISPVY